MKRAEETIKGLLAIDPDDTGENILRFGRMKYNGKYGYYVPDCILTLEDFISWNTKTAAKQAATRLGFTQDKVEKIGSRFYSCWGLRYDFRDNYFLAVFD